MNVNDSIRSHFNKDDFAYPMMASLISRHSVTIHISLAFRFIETKAPSVIRASMSWLRVGALCCNALQIPIRNH